MGNILLSELLTFCAFPLKASHQGRPPSRRQILVEDLYRMGEFEVYQSYSDSVGTPTVST